MSVEKLFEKFINDIKEKGLYVEAVAVADGEDVILSHRFVPDRPRNIYSHTKSITATSIGIAIENGLISIGDKFADYFPEYCENADMKIFDMTLGDLLTMRSGFGKPILMDGRTTRATGCPDYLAHITSNKMLNKPGERFVYSNADTYMASRMLEKAVGCTLARYTWENIFKKIGIGWPVWGHEAMGHTFPASDLYLGIDDQLKLGQIYLNGGCYRGQRIVGEAWVKDASSPHVIKNGNPLYGYQFWMSPWCNGYRADGKFLQITTVIPDRGLVVAVQCPEYGNPDETEPVYNKLLNDIYLEK